MLRGRVLRREKLILKEVGPRIRFCCVHASLDLVVFGANTGTVYYYRRQETGSDAESLALLRYRLAILESKQLKHKTHSNSHQIFIGWLLCIPTARQLGSFPICKLTLVAPICSRCAPQTFLSIFCMPLWPYKSQRKCCFACVATPLSPNYFGMERGGISTLVRAPVWSL